MEELKPVTDQVPDLWRFVSRTLDMQESGMANRVGSNVNLHLGGKRVGPYCFLAKPKATPGPYTLEICFNTEHTWYDSRDRETTLDQASRVQERFVSIDIKPWKQQGARSRGRGVP
jgi:hypothetical protein